MFVNVGIGMSGFGIGKGGRGRRGWVAWDCAVGLKFKKKSEIHTKIRRRMNE
jgi:hypothetical protein